MNLYDLDIEQFWKDDELAHRENCFSTDAPQVALGIRMSDECVFAELNEPGEEWGYTPPERRMELNKRYNDITEKIVGKRLLREYYPPEDSGAVFPKIKSIDAVFECKSVRSGGSDWLESDCDSPQKLEKLLERVNKLSIRDCILPPNWESEKKRIFEEYGYMPKIFRGIRGPVTLATSIFGVENLIFLIMDEPDIAKYFSQTISDVLFQMAITMDEEAGYTPENKPSGFGFADDNCCMLNDEMYTLFGYPILKRMFEYWSPNPGDRRFQHSDSPMGHLLPVLSKLNLDGCNFGPTVTVSEIRKYMPKTRIDGQLAPFTFMSNDEDEIIKEVKRDCEMARESRGLNLCTAGSINNGSRLTSMRAVMYAVQKYGRY